MQGLVRKRAQNCATNGPHNLSQRFKTTIWCVTSKDVKPFHMAHPLDIIFAALADPTRRAILAMLLEDDMAVTDVADPFEMSLAAISKHLHVLTAAGLISQEKRGRVKWCKLEPDTLREASTWMQGFGQMGGLDLDAFERFLESEFTPDVL
jgi:DNA-binding transcriptional ArsR family regulator